ncbi:MAG TPA: peptide chain release factor 1 [Ignavibacteria bacterium]|nr:peptide chain release factor 1 [Ignavibacteria bacterium]HRF66103.1 peptide chain release factor 1 [Ignavibacteria bacterium]HRJ03521.1 peptide chain release factor 1 [Ignavibacteria bacterium]HRJ84105.1 peptide chain release factor 1 [Ignavibacteria bacterium]
MFDKLEKVKLRFNEIAELLNQPGTANDQKEFRRLSKEYSDLTDIVNAYDEYIKVKSQLEENKKLLYETNDAEMKELAAGEQEELQSRYDKLEAEMKELLVPKDPNDSKNAMLEIRAGTGGDEAALFAADLYRMYSRFAERTGWKMELVTYNESSGLGGLKEVIVSVSGKDIYGTLKYESGVHRVQRVPETETQGRVHTSAASVAVLPEADEVDVDINPSDLKIDVFRSGGAGGQNVNKVETAIRITHIPTGVVVQCQDERSQLKNKQKAMKVLRSRLLEAEIEKHDKETSQKRKLMVGSGDRSDKIRTYNFPQNRLTDHRIGLTMYNLSQVMEGDLAELFEKLKIADRSEKLSEEQTG